MRTVLALAMVALELVAVSSAQAYSCHEDFARPPIPPEGSPEPVTYGGGGGRFFTGSVEDGLTCGVCHLGRDEPIEATFTIDGPLEAGYVPGTTYRLELLLPEEEPRIAGSIEVTDVSGAGIGSLTLLAEDAQQALDRCQVAHPCGADVPDPTQAASLSDVGEDRSVATVDACGATRLVVEWHAPPEAVGPVRIHAVAVASDASGDPTGDAAFAYATLVAPEGEVAMGADVAAACGIAHRPPSDSGPFAWLALVVAWAARGRKIRRLRR